MTGLGASVVKKTVFFEAGFFCQKKPFFLGFFCFFWFFLENRQNSTQMLVNTLN